MIPDTRNQKPETRDEKTEKRKKKPEDRKQRTETKGQRPENRDQKTENRELKAESINREADVKTSMEHELNPVSSFRSLVSSMEDMYEKSTAGIQPAFGQQECSKEA